MSRETVMMKGGLEDRLEFEVYLSGRTWVVEVSRDGQILKERAVDCSQTPCLGIHQRDRTEAEQAIAELVEEIKTGTATPIAEKNPHAQATADAEARLAVCGLRSLRVTTTQAEREIKRTAEGAVAGFVSAPVWLLEIEAVLPNGTRIHITDRADGLDLAAEYIEGRAYAAQ